MKTKRMLSLALAVILMLALAVPAFGASTVRSKQALSVNGKSVTCDIYNIDGSNYFKLRDLAYLMNGTESQFEVGWDAVNKSIAITTGKSYTPAGGELVVGDDLSGTAVPSAQTIYIDGVKRSDLSVYNIGGNNFFKLRDLGTAVTFIVDYDGATKTMIVESTDYAAGKKPEPTPAPTPAPTPEPTPAPTEAPKVILPVEAPTAPGTVTAEKNGGTIDYSNIKDGYVMAKFKENFDKRLKVRVEGPTTTYDYNLKLNEWATFPLSDGNGDYKVGIYKEASGGKYSLVVSATFNATLTDEFAPFLRPNQYVNYTNAVNTVAKAKELTKNQSTALEKLAAIYDFVVGNFAYDDDLAATVESGYLPDVEAVLASKKGICFDYAAIMAAMLRSQGIPCKLIVGYAGDVYHAWLSVYSQEDGWIDGAVFFDGKNWSRMDPTFASTGGNTEEIKKYIGDGSNYLAKYFY